RRVAQENTLLRVGVDLEEIVVLELELKIIHNPGNSGLKGHLDPGKPHPGIDLNSGCLSSHANLRGKVQVHAGGHELGPLAGRGRGKGDEVVESLELNQHVPGRIEPARRVAEGPYVEEEILWFSVVDGELE